ncbi:tetratricopeptide repeat protein [Methanobrevibacter filiformis]|nr:tetratricopeptide repeat protein [Methanobrevibacter filiformis]
MLKFDEVLLIDPEFKDTFILKGQTNEFLGNYTEAIKYYEFAINFDVNNVLSWKSKARCLFNSGFYEDSQEVLDNGLFYNENNMDLLLTKCDFFEQQENYNDELECVEYILNNVDYEEGLLLKGHVFELQNKSEFAFEIYNILLDLNPNNVVVLNNLANLYYKMDKLTDAINYMGKVVELDPSNPYLFIYAFYLEENGNYEGALKYISKSIKKDDGALDSYYRKGICLEKLGMLIKAKKSYENGLMLCKKFLDSNYLFDGNIYYMISEYLMKLNKREEADDYYNKFLEFGSKVNM